MNKNNNILNFLPVIIIVLIFIVLRLLSGNTNDNYASDESSVKIVDSTVNESNNTDSSEVTDDNIDDNAENNTGDNIEDNTKDNTKDNTDDYSEENSFNKEEKSYTFRKQSLYEQHFEKHGAEMGYTNKEDYLAGANRVINDPNSLHKTEEEDGDDIYYLEATNEIVFVSPDGYIRTYFSPSRGIEYYNKQ